jgi:NitT/TauT family transport system substrate-binding protein
VDIVLKQLSYDACITQYGAGQVDAVCITNMDILSPALGRASVAICPTSTSAGADACIVVGIDDVKALREHKVYGLDKSVSEYCFVRNLELQGEKESDHKFTSKGPDEAALAMQSNPDSTKAIMVWNPFVLQTLRKVKDSKVLFDSSTIPGEIVDMLVMAKESLAKPGGKEFACAIIDTFYHVSNMIDAEATHDETLLALAAKFAPELTVADMEEVVTQTAFYKTPDAGTELYSSEPFKTTMGKVLAFCTSHGMVDKEPSIVYGQGDGQLRFDTSYMQMVKEKP